MKKSNLTKQQTLALLITLRKELGVLFSNTPELDKLPGPDLRKRIVDDLFFLIKEGYETDPENVDIYEVFNSK